MEIINRDDKPKFQRTVDIVALTASILNLFQLIFIGSLLIYGQTIEYETDHNTRIGKILFLIKTKI